MSLSTLFVKPLEELFTSCIVRIHIQGRVSGTGFFVAPGLILTCAHVVKTAWQTKTLVEVYRHDNQTMVMAQILQCHEINYPDLALLHIEQVDHPCVLLDTEIDLNDLLYSYGHPSGYTDGDSMTLIYEGPTGSQEIQLKLKAGQALPGMSGAPLLNQRTGKVCGILRTTRDERMDLGGRAIPTTTIWQTFTELKPLLEQFHQQDSRWLRLLPSPTRYSLTSQMVRQMLGSSVQLVQLDQVKPASKQRNQRYYEGALLSWDVLAAHADVYRVKHNELLQSIIEHSEQMHMLCLHGEPGAGKSTLAWRLAADAAQTLQHPLLYLKNNEDSDIWYKLEDFFAQYDNDSIVLLVDDIFRNQQVGQALQSLNTELPLLIIATSRSNEIPHSLRLPFDPDYQEVGVPTVEEKKLVLQKLGIDEAMLDTPSRKRFRKASSWLTMMLELTTGKDLEMIIQDTVDRLRQQDALVYKAYEYLCFAGQYDQGIPESLLEALDEQGRFYKLAERPASTALLVIDDENKTVRTQHALIARQTLQVYKRDPLIIARELITALHIDQDNHRTFLSSLFLQLVSDQQEPLVRKLLEQHAEKIEAILSVCNGGDLFYHWARVYYQLGDRDRAAKLEQDVLSRPTQTRADISARFSIIVQQGSKKQITQLVNEVNEWLSIYPEDFCLHQRYLGLLARYGDKAQITQALDGTTAWLTVHPQDTNVRQTYLSLLTRLGDKELLSLTLEDTRAWLNDHPHDANVRQTYLGLLERLGDKTQISLALEDTRVWLNDHPHDTHVRHTYLGLLERLGDKALLSLALEDTRAWLNSHPRYANVNQTYLGLLERLGDKAQISLALEDIRVWLNSHPHDTQVRHTYLGLLKRLGDKALLAPVLEDTRAWLNDHPHDTHVRQIYLSLLERLGDKALLSLVLEDTRAWLSSHPHDTAVRHTYLGLVARLGDKALFALTLEDTKAWLNSHPHDAYVRQTYLGLIKRLGDKALLALALEGSKAWLNDHPHDTVIRHTYLELVPRLDDKTQLALALEDTRTWLNSHPHDTAVRQTYLGVVEQQGDNAQLSLVLEDTKAWLAAHPQDTAIRQCYLGLVEQHSDKTRLSLVLEDTKAWLAAHPHDTKVHRTYLGLVERQNDKALLALALEDTRAWLNSHPHDTHVRRTYLGVAERQGDKALLSLVLEDTRVWLNSHPHDTNVRQTYLGLLERLGDKAQIALALEGTRAWLNSHSQDAEVRKSYLGLVERQGDKALLSLVLEDTKAWLATHPQDTTVRQRYLSLVEQHGDKALLSLVLEDTKAWLATHPQNTTVHQTYLGVVKRLGNKARS